MAIMPRSNISIGNAITIARSPILNFIYLVDNGLKLKLKLDERRAISAWVVIWVIHFNRRTYSTDLQAPNILLARCHQLAVLSKFHSEYDI